MKTLLTNNVNFAAAFVKQGEVVAFPTETVYGLGANAYDEKAVKKIFKAKGRPADNPLIVHIASKKDIAILVESIPEVAHKIINKFFPGPITIIFEKNEIVPAATTAGLGTIAIRMPSSKIARYFINACGVPVAAPSANLSGSPSPTSFEHVLDDFNGKIPCVLVGRSSKFGLESTVVDCTTRIPKILRPGVITLEQLKKIDPRIKVARNSKKIKSPGQKYKHYAPKAKVKLIANCEMTIAKLKTDGALIGIEKSFKGNGLNVKICRDLNDYAKNLFSFFRECDKKKIRAIYAQKVSEEGIGLAIMNRLKKASSS